MTLHLLWSKPIELSELPIRQWVAPVGGVYVLWPSWPTMMRTPIYVGSARDLQRRLMDHFSGAYGRGALPPLDEGRALFQFAPLDQTDLRKEVASFLQTQMRPTSNRRTLRSSTCVVNVPTDPWGALAHG